MAYFLPSYFQKRLLRYALTRLDFIDTDALDLEDLDVTIGQRSVVELKNVGIKVDKLIERLQLPSALVLRNALIRRLRITIPANLHVSGILVVVDGVEIHVEVQEQETVPSKPNSPAETRDGNKYDDLPSTPRQGQEPEHVIPTSRDLAQSFLDTEPRHERVELEAALQSQSTYMTDSTSSLDETGLGNPGGFSLPGFVANFFAGVADRLEVELNNLEVVAGFSMPSEGTVSETAKLLLRVGKISLTSLIKDETVSEPKRSIQVSSLEILLLSEPETFSQHSTSSSPRLSKARSKISSTLSSDGFTQFESPDNRFSSQLEKSSLSEGPPSELHLDSHSPGTGRPGDSSDPELSESSMLMTSQVFEPSASQSVVTASRLHDLSNPFVDNRRHAENILGSAGLPDTTPKVNMHSSIEEDLSESRVFTHDEAESMYMSAISNNFGPSGMPGGWASTIQPESHQLKSDRNSRIPAIPPVQAAQLSFVEPTAVPLETTTPMPKEMPPHGFRERLFAESPNLLSKRLIGIDYATIMVPSSVARSKPESPTSDYTQPSYDLRTNPPSIATTSDGGLGSAFVKDANILAGSLMSQSSNFRHGARDFVVAQDFMYDITLGNISCFLDLSICRILIKVATTLKKLLPPGHSEPSTGQSVSDLLSLALRIDSININLCESVAGSSLLSPNHVVEVCLLRFSFSKIKQDFMRFGDAVKQKITVEKIELGHSSEKVLYFIDSMNVQNSIATSVMIRHHDLVVLQVNERFDVQLKPIHIVLDLLLVDEILSRGGGLDSLLDLGASVASTGTVREPLAKPPAVQRQRTVRFDRPSSRPPIDQPGPKQGHKIDIRLSGAFVDLVGSECTLQLKTTAIKIVSRTGRARVQLEHAVLLGPLLHGSRTAAEINVKLVNTTIIYMETPEEEDLDRLLSLLTPSSNRYDEEDDIMVDTLIRQRRKGGVLRLSTSDIQVNIRGIAWHQHVIRIGDELSKLSAVSKYLPEDDRPGILSFALIEKIGLKVDLGRSFGMLHMNVKLFEGAHVSIPSLMSAQISSISVRRGEDDFILAEVIPNIQDSVLMGPPMLMCRFIADEMEPTVRVKLSNSQIEYRLATVIAFTELLESLQKEGVRNEVSDSPPHSEMSSSHSEMSDFARKVRFSLGIRNSTIGLNPHGLPSKGLFLLSDSTIYYSGKQKSMTTHLELRKASILIINNISKLGQESSNVDHRLYFEENDQVQQLTKSGYVPVGSISNASAIVTIEKSTPSAPALIDVEFRNNLFLLETCADSTQTLIQILSALSPPSAPSTTVNYRTEIVSIQDMLSSFTGNAFVAEQGPELGLQASQLSSVVSTTVNNYSDDDINSHDEDDGTEYDEDEDEDEEENGNYEDDEYEEDIGRARFNPGGSLTDSYAESDLSRSGITGSVHVAPVNLTADDEPSIGDSVIAHSMLDFRTDHFVQDSSVGGTAHRWNSARNTYELGSEDSVKSSPLKVRVRDVHIIWNLFDGYDWQSTRDTISRAVQDIEAKAMARQTQKDSRRSQGQDDDESVIGDFLFNSIYIGIPANKDPKDLASAINQDIGDLISETGSYATETTVTTPQTYRPTSFKAKHKGLRLNRSKQHKMTFELRGVSADVLTFPPESGEVQSSVDVRIKMLEIFDHVPTSTWKKFATYMSEAGEREVDTSMIHIELLNVKPIAELSASEIVLKLTVLPLRLHVDQDALDFLTRFFEFKDDTAPKSSTPSVPPFIQRAEVNPIKLRLDFKPKRVDYGGLRSGRTTEFMNFFTLDRSNMVLRRVILYGVSGFDRLGLMLNDIWSPDVRRNQLPGVLAGLAPIRSLVDVGSGVKDLIAVPIREYKKDGRIVRSIQKGALAFVKTTTTELVNLGAKLAIGTQTVLQGAENILTARNQSEHDEEKEQISLYADQPLGIVQGLRGAYASLERDLLLAKDAIVAVPGEVMASGSATGAAKAVLRQSPTIILRPAIGASKAIGQTLLGAGNTLDKRNPKRIEDKYKRH